MVSRTHEHGSTAVEYVGLAAVSAMVLSGIVSALDSAAGDRLAAAIVRRLLDAVTSGS